MELFPKYCTLFFTGVIITFYAKIRGKNTKTEINYILKTSALQITPGKLF